MRLAAWPACGKAAADGGALRRSLQGKLDWILLSRGLGSRSRSQGNDDYKLSDHKWLLVDVFVSAAAGDKEEEK